MTAIAASLTLAAVPADAAESKRGGRAERSERAPAKAERSSSRSERSSSSQRRESRPQYQGARQQGSERRASPPPPRQASVSGRSEGIQRPAQARAPERRPEQPRSNANRNWVDDARDRAREIRSAGVSNDRNDRDWNRGRDNDRNGRDWNRDRDDRNGRDWNGRDRNYRDGNRNGSYRDRDRNGSYRDGRNWSRDRDWNDGRRGDHRRWDRRWRDNSRYDWYRYRSVNRSLYRGGYYYAPYRSYSYRRLNIGFYLDSLFFGSRYWINDPWQYRLPEVYGPYRWVRYYDDVLLVDIYSGQVVDVIYDFFW